MKILMCRDCDGLGTLGGSKYVTESCQACKGSGKFIVDRQGKTTPIPLYRKKSDLNTLTDNIKQWAKDRNLNTADPSKQFLKLIEETGELAEGMAKSKPHEIKDALGDMYVVMTILAVQMDIDIVDCVDMAYNEIKDRRGKMVNGVFVKESDLS